MNRGFRTGHRAYQSFQSSSAGSNFYRFRAAQAGAQHFSTTMNTQFKMMQIQQLRLNATSLLCRSITLNALILDQEAEAGQVANSSEDAEVEDDDG